jgi:hypothetical protein
MSHQSKTQTITNSTSVLKTQTYSEQKNCSVLRYTLVFSELSFTLSLTVIQS